MNQNNYADQPGNAHLGSLPKMPDEHMGSREVHMQLVSGNLDTEQAERARLENDAGRIFDLLEHQNRFRNASIEDCDWALELGQQAYQESAYTVTCAAEIDQLVSALKQVHSLKQV